MLHIAVQSVELPGPPVTATVMLAPALTVVPVVEPLTDIVAMLALAPNAKLAGPGHGDTEHVAASVPLKFAVPPDGTENVFGVTVTPVICGSCPLTVTCKFNSVKAHNATITTPNVKMCQRFMLFTASWMRNVSLCHGE